MVWVENPLRINNVIYQKKPYRFPFYKPKLMRGK